MLVQVGLESKGFATLFTNEGFHFGVRLDVRAQVGLVGERLGACFTLEWFFTCVCSNVPLEQPGPGEALGAVRAAADLVVRAQVHGVGRHGHVDLAALGAGPRFAVVRGAVDLAVPGEVGRGRIVLAAVPALVALTTTVAFWNIFGVADDAFPFEGVRLVEIRETDFC